MALLLILQKKLFRRFMDGHPGPWGAMTVAVFGVRRLWKWNSRKEQIEYRTVLKPGETITVTNTTDTEASLKRDRRKARRATRRAKRGRSRNRAEVDVAG